MSLSESAFSEINDLSVRSNRPDRLITEALTSAIQFSPQLELHCLTTADLLRGTDLSKARIAFQEAIEGCQWLVDTLVHVRGAAVNIGTPIERAETWFLAEQTTAKAIKDVGEAFERDDQTLVADLLEYELTAALAMWNHAITGELDRRR